MRIAVLEWICGGGLAGSHASQALSELKPEGWAMLSCLVTGLREGGFDVSTVLDRRIKEARRLPAEMEVIDAGVRLCLERSPQGDSGQVLPAGWRELAEECDYVLVIAPETDGILEQITLHLQGSAAQLINCCGPALVHAADKLATHRVLEHAGLPQPATCLAQEMTADWLNAVEQEVGHERWVVKPRFGVGGAGMWVCDRQQLERMLSNEAPGESAMASSNETTADFEPPSPTGPDSQLDSQWIVQPWIAGPSFSRSAVVDHAGRWHWLPLVTQHFRPTRLSAGDQLQYLGGSLADEATQGRFPEHLLEDLPRIWGPGSNGWISFDFVFSHEQGRWLVIEVNPRCTTSLIGLCAAYSGNLPADLVRSQWSGFTGLLGAWTPATFTAQGDLLATAR